MRHLKQGRKFSRTPSHRRALYRNMVTSLFLHERIETTLPKAKEIRRIAERLITISKRVTAEEIKSAIDDDNRAELVAKRLHAIRIAERWIKDRSALKRLFDTYASWYKERPGGYTRIYRLDFRPSDNAPVALLELLIPRSELEIREKVKKEKEEGDRKKKKKKKKESRRES